MKVLVQFTIQLFTIITGKCSYIKSLEVEMIQSKKDYVRCIINYWKWQSSKIYFLKESLELENKIGEQKNNLPISKLENHKHSLNEYIKNSNEYKINETASKDIVNNIKANLNQHPYPKKTI